MLSINTLKINQAWLKQKVMGVILGLANCGMH
jgi:hypothetical protein